MPLTYRLWEPRDVPDIQRLWKEETGWGELSDIGREWFRQNPCEGSMVVVAVDESERVVGEFVFIAYRVRVNGREYRALRALAPIVSQEWRKFRTKDPVDHPMSGMYRFGALTAKERGDGLMFMLPNPSFKRFLNMFPGMRSRSRGEPTRMSRWRFVAATTW